MDGYKSVSRYEIVDSVARDRSLWPDSAVFQIQLSEPLKKVTEVSVIQTSIPNIQYNITNANNKVIMVHMEYGKRMKIKVSLSPGHYDVYTFTEELQRQLNLALEEAYAQNNVEVDKIYRDVSGNVRVASSTDATYAYFENEDGSTDIVLLSSLVPLQSFGQYNIQFLSIKGRIRIYFTQPAANFILVFAPPMDAAQTEIFEELEIRPEELIETPHVFMGFDNRRNYSNELTKEEYDASVIGLEPGEIDTNDAVNRNMIMSTRYMNIFNDPYVYFHVLELIMNPLSIPSFWTDPSGTLQPGEAIKKIFEDKRLLTRPLGKILINALPGEVVFYNYTDYPNTMELRDFYNQTFKDLTRVTVVWTKKDGTILNFNQVDVVVVLQFVLSSAPHDDD